MRIDAASPRLRRARRVVAIAIGVVALLAVACVNMILRPQQSQYLEYAATPGIDLGDVSPDESVVVFLRPEDVRVRTTTVLDGDELVTILTERTFFVYRTTAGPHAFMGWMAGGASFVDAELAPGRIYVIAFLAHSDTVPVFLLKPIVPEGDLWTHLGDGFATSKEVTLRPEASDWFAEHRDELSTRRETRSDAWRIRKLAASSGASTLPSAPDPEYDPEAMWLIH